MWCWGQVVVFPKMEVLVCRTFSLWRVCWLGRLICLQLEWQCGMLLKKCLQSFLIWLELEWGCNEAITTQANLEKSSKGVFWIEPSDLSGTFTPNNKFEFKSVVSVCSSCRIWSGADFVWCVGGLAIEIRCMNICWNGPCYRRQVALP